MSYENDPLSSLYAEYLTMLDNHDSPTSEVTPITASHPPNSLDEETAQAILSVLHAGEPDDVSFFAHGVPRVIDRLLLSSR